MRITDKYVLFWNGEFSQWYDSKIVFNKLVFRTAEHFMMYHKALYFSDTNIAEKILKTYHPKEVKALGRQIKNFDPILWNTICKDIVTLGNYLKFTQCAKLNTILLKYKDKRFVEASPVDKIWGIGLSEDDPNCDDEKNWKGSNYLGECLDNVLSIIVNKDFDRYEKICTKILNLH